MRAFASIACWLAASFAASAARADVAPLPNAGSPTQTPSTPPIAPTESNVRSPDDTVRPPDDNVRSPDDVDALGAMSIRHAEGISGSLDLAVAHDLAATDVDSYAVAAGARVELLPGLAFDGVLPVAYGDRAVALGNAMIGAAWLPRNNRLVGIELRVAAPTSPHHGDGAIADANVALPRVADPELFMVQTSSAELVADWRWRGDAWWLQVEAGAAGWWQPIGYTTVLRATLAAGLHVTSWLDATASFVTRLLVVSSDTSDNFIHAGLLGVVAHGRRGDAALRIELPVDQVARDAHAVTLGLELRAR